MATNYAKPLPFDKKTVPLQNYPAATSTLGSIYRDNASASSVTSLHENTTVIEVTAEGGAAGIRWAINQATSILTDAGVSDFDNVIADGETRRFVVPRNTQAIPNYSGIDNPSVVGLNVAEGLFSNVATVSFGAGSVLLSQN